MIDGLARKTRLAVIVDDVVGDLGLGEQTVVVRAPSGSPPPPRCFLFLPRLDLPHITCTGGRDCGATGDGGVCSSRKVSEVHGRAKEDLRGGGTEEALLADGGVGGKSE